MQIELVLTEKEWYKKACADAKLYGVKWSVIKELIDLFNRAGYNVEIEQEFKDLKRDYFNKVN